MNKVSALALKQVKDLDSDVHQKICIIKHTVDSSNRKNREDQIALNSLNNFISSAPDEKIDPALRENLLNILNNLIKGNQQSTSDIRKAVDDIEIAMHKISQSSTWLSAVMDDNH